MDDGGAEQVRAGVRSSAVNRGPVLEALLSKLGRGDLLASVVVQHAQHYALGYPIVAHRRGEYTVTCPVPTCLIMRGDCLDTRVARQVWLSHTALRHPGFAACWPDQQWPLKTPPHHRLPDLREPVDLFTVRQVPHPGDGGDVARFGLAGASAQPAHTLDLATGRTTVPGSVLQLSRTQIDALLCAGDVEGPVCAVVLHRRDRRALLLGPFTSRAYAWQWWHTPANKAVRNHDPDVLLATVEVRSCVSPVGDHGTVS